MSLDTYSPELTRIEFQQVPLIGTAEIEDTYRRILYLRRFPLGPSFGAFVVRRWGPENARSFAERFYESDSDDINITTFSPKEEKGLHKDSGARNSVTTHATFEGEVDAIVLVGSNIDILHPLSPEDTERVFDYGLIDPGRVATPILSLRTHLEEDDVMILDHTQPHAFRSTTYPRYSEGYFSA